MTNFINKRARGLDNFTEEAPQFETNRKASFEELRQKKEMSQMSTRSAGSGKYEKRAREASIEEGTQVDFIVSADGKYFYVGDVKQDNTMLHTIEDVPMVNVVASVAVNIDNNKDVVTADISRLTIGDEELRNRVNFDDSKKMVATDGRKYQINNQKSLSLMTTIPESNLDKDGQKLINELYLEFQSLHDFAMDATERSAIGKGSTFRKQTMFLSSKDVLKGLIRAANPDASDDEINKTVGRVFADNGVGPLSTMSLNLKLTVSKVVRTKDETQFPEYSQIDKRNGSLRTFVTAFNVSVPMNPQILIEISPVLEKFKEAMISRIISVHNLALDEEAGTIELPFPDMSIEKHNLGGITEEEFTTFQTEVLPKAAIEGIEALRKLDETRAKRRYVENARGEESDDDFNA